jgi:hypothetical protein
MTTDTALMQAVHHLNSAQSEYSKFQSGNGAASTRARKALQEVIANVKICRKQITEEKNERKAAKAAAVA